jgi:drug/metabolite transporter (DMT)-like permease
VVTLIATATWALGTTLNRKHTSHINPFFNSGLQLLTGGLIMLVISPITENYSGIQWWNTEGILALVYVTILGSAVAYAAYSYALSKLPVGIATIYAYINPLIAVMAGFLFLHEELNIYTALAFATIVLSVYLMNRGYRKQHVADAKTDNLEKAFPESVPVE